MKMPSAPAATAALASGATKDRFPPEQPSPPPGNCDGMRRIKDHRKSEAFHAEYGSHVRDKVAVSEAGSAFSKEDVADFRY